MNNKPPNDPRLDTLLCFNAYALNRAFGRFYQAAFSETGMTYPKFVILMALDEAGPMTVSELSSKAGVEPNTLSPLLKKMAGFGILTRTRAEQDERRVLIDITEFGTQVLTRARRVVTEGYEALDLSQADPREPLTYMEKVRCALERAQPPKLIIDDLKAAQSSKQAGTTKR